MQQAITHNFRLVKDRLGKLRPYNVCSILNVYCSNKKNFKFDLNEIDVDANVEYCPCAYGREHASLNELSTT